MSFSGSINVASGVFTWYELLLFSRSVVSHSLWPHELQNASLPVLHHLPELAQTYVHWVNDTIQSSCPLSPRLLFLTSIFPSIRVFSNESVLCISWPKYWSFSFRISPFKAYSGLISFRIYRFDLLAVQGILKSLYQHHRSKESILWGSAFFGNFPRDSDGKESACNVEDLGWKVALEKGMATNSSILAWRIPCTKNLMGYSPWDRIELDMTDD